MTPDSSLQETQDDDGFVSPAGSRFNINYNQLTALLTQAMKGMLAQLGLMNQDIAALKVKDSIKDNRIKDLEELNRKVQSENASMKAYLCNKDPNAAFCPSTP